MQTEIIGQGGLTLSQRFPFGFDEQARVVFTHRAVVADVEFSSIYVVRAQRESELNLRVQFLLDRLQRSEPVFVICRDCSATESDGFMGNPYKSDGTDAEGWPVSAHIIDALSQQKWYVLDGNSLSGHGYINVYLHDRAYGGPEEGGWWYSCGEVVASLPCDDVHSDASVQLADSLRDWCHTQNADRPPIHSMSSEGEYVVLIEMEAGRDYPATRPRYE